MLTNKIQIKKKETSKISSKQPNFIPKLSRKRTNKTQSWYKEGNNKN